MFIQEHAARPTVKLRKNKGQKDIGLLQISSYKHSVKKISDLEGILSQIKSH